MNNTDWMYDIKGEITKTDLVNYKDEIASSFFINKCNLACPYCHNCELIQEKTEDSLENFYSFVKYIEFRKKIINHVVISGGEPLSLDFYAISNMLYYLKDNGYKIKLDTNGVAYESLDKLICNPDTKPDYIAIDLKTTDYTKCKGNSKCFENVIKSIDLIDSAYNKDEYEIRSVLVPKHFDKDELLKIAKYIPKKTNWYIANFVPGTCIDDSYNHIIPYIQSDYDCIIEEIRKNNPDINISKR